MLTRNIYCDESGHLEHDREKFMVLGAVWCPAEKARESAVRLREIKDKHGLRTDCELKWTSVSRSKANYFLDVLDYFFDDNDLHFRAVVIDKALLNHAAYETDHDTWYYKMYFQLLDPLLDPGAKNRIYIDIKDTRSQTKVAKLHDVLCNSIYDFDHSIVDRVQQVRSHHVEHVQLADFLVGIVSYRNKLLNTNEAKLRLVDRMKHRSRLGLDRTTLLGAPKVNLLIWQPKGRQL